MPKGPCAGRGSAGAGGCQSPAKALVNPVPLQLAFVCRPVNSPSFSMLPSCCQALQLCLCLWLLLPCSERTSGLTFNPRSRAAVCSSHQPVVLCLVSASTALCRAWPEAPRRSCFKGRFSQPPPCLLTGGGALCHVGGFPNAGVRPL